MDKKYKNIVKIHDGVAQEGIPSVEPSNVEVRLDAERKGTGKPIYTKLKMGEVPRVTLRRSSRQRERAPNPTSDDMRPNPVGLGGGTRIP